MSSRDRAQLNLPLSESASDGDAPELGESAGILLVTNDPSIGPVLSAGLREVGHAVAVVGEARAALSALKADPLPSVVILDLALPDMRGTEFCRAVRSERRTRAVPLVVVTARDTEADRIIAFELGADDFVGVPFSVREVILRVRVQLRRSVGDRPKGGIIEVGSLRLNSDAHRVWVNEREISLSVREFRLLQALMERSERVLSRPTLLDLVWGAAANIGVRAVDAYVTRLRRKLGSARDYVETVSSVGYRLKRPMG
jgi:two-component system, OmpR family, phosphate regulon response regulator PhoB